MRLNALNAADEDTVVRALLRCCGSTRWARAMAAARPFASVHSMLEAADDLWARLSTNDLLEAFAAHPRIGREGQERQKGKAGHADWSAQEQAGAAMAPDGVLERLAAGNRAYEARFGYIFIICATGKSAAEMLAALETRLHHGAADELRIAAEEQRKITRLRLAKFVDNDDRTP